MSELEDNHRAEFEAVLLIEIARMNDLLSIIAHAADPDRTDAIMLLHEKGGIMYPPPAIAVSDDTGA